MFKVGDTVLYGSDGVCKIEEITQKVFGGSAIEYYVLKSVFDNRSKIFVPTKNQKLIEKMHHVLSSDEIRDIVESCPEYAQWTDDDVKRSSEFKEIISGGDIKDIALMVKSIICHKEEISKKGKNLHKADELIFKDAVKILYEEFALVMDITKDDVTDIICKKTAVDDLIKKTV